MNLLTLAACAALLICTAAFVHAAEATPPPGLVPKILRGTDSFLSGGKKIKVETFLPAGSGRLPAVVVLYGSGGAFLGKGEMVDFSRKMAAAGTAVFMIHYFNRTGTIAARDPQIRRHTNAWAETVHDGVLHILRHPRVNPERLGMYGYSLGAYLSVAEGARNPQVDAVAELSGGILGVLKGKVTRLPALLMLHGRLDQRVEFAEAVELERTARKLGAPLHTRFYDQEGHRLTKPALEDAQARAVEFLEGRLLRAWR